MNKKCINSIIILVFSCYIDGFAQETYQETYSDFKKKAQSDYDDFRKKANQEYADWMKKAWDWHKKIELLPRPKDNMLPPIIFNKEERLSNPKPVLIYGVEPEPELQPQPKPVVPIKENEGDCQLISFLFYGTEGKVRLPSGTDFKLNGRNEDAFAKGWEKLSSGKYDNLIRDCLLLRMEHQLCDWAYLMMLRSMSEKACGGWNNEARMMQGFVLCQSGYKIRFGMTQAQELRVLFKSDHTVFDLDGFKLDDGLYYVIEPTCEEGLKICDVSYPEEKPLSLWISQEQLFAELPSADRVLIPEDKAISIHSHINKNWIDFCNNYPTSMIGEDIVTRWAMYANTPLAKDVKAKIYPQFKAAFKKYNIADVVNAADWLLYWVQTAFVYEYDDKVWGGDRAFFAEETLYYPYCDCEDRSILYSRLVRDLLGLDVILVFYPGHLATAVAFNVPVKGDYIELNGKRYTICDPTYIGAPIGITMPEMDNKMAKIILLKR